MNNTYQRIKPKSDLVQLLICILIPLAIGSVAGMFVKDAPYYYISLILPSFAPPAEMFSPAWTILYILIGIASCRILRKSGDERAKLAIRLYAVSLVLNFLWPLTFFLLQSNLLGLIIAILLVIIGIIALIAFFRLDRKAGILMIPYVLWLIYATVLNYAILRLN